MTKSELESKPLSELHALAAAAGVERYRMLARAELVDALADGGGGGSSGSSRGGGGGGGGRAAEAAASRAAAAAGHVVAGAGSPAAAAAGASASRVAEAVANGAGETVNPAATASREATASRAGARSAASASRRVARSRRRRPTAPRDLQRSPSADAGVASAGAGARRSARRDCCCRPPAPPGACLAESREACTELLRGSPPTFPAAKGPDPVALLIDPSPEELADWKREAPQAEIVSAGQARHADDALAQAVRRAESGEDVILS